MSASDPNPYAPPQIGQEEPADCAAFSADEVRRRLALPAFGILVSVLINAGCLAYVSALIALEVIAGASLAVIDLVWALIAISAAVILSCLAARGAIAMLRLDDYRAALRGAWFAIVPCNVGCLVALPFALYADWLLRDPRVHAAFSPRRVSFRSRPSD